MIYLGDIMSFFDTIILSVIFMIFPISSILLFKAYTKSIGKINRDNLIDVANIVSTFLLIKYCNIEVSYAVMLVNVPFVISILYNRKYASILIAIILVLFNYFAGYNIYVVVLEYLIYILLFLVLTKKRTTYDALLLWFIFIKGVSLTIREYYILANDNLISVIKIFISLMLFYLIGMLVIKIISKIEETISLNQTLKELEKEKNLKNSLFKITHEVKNPLAVCKGYLSMMNPDDANQVKKYNEIILSEINRTLDIMDNFSEYTKINVNLDLMDVDSLICDTLNNMNIMFKSHNIKVNYNYTGDEIFINGDYLRLKQVLVNILKNSVEAICDNGVIDISYKITKKNVFIKIKDNGPGISEEALNKIGQLFYSSKDKGCGIGVTLSKEIIKLHGGNLIYKSVEGEYTEAIIKLPVYNDLHEKV